METLTTWLIRGSSEKFPDVQEIRSISCLLEPIKMFIDSHTHYRVWGPNYKAFMKVVVFF
jgi:hypothetical protein